MTPLILSIIALLLSVVALAVAIAASRGLMLGEYLASIMQHSSSTLRAWLHRPRVWWRNRILRREHYLRERYGIRRKPKGWNAAVKHWFFAGPECRIVEGGFSDAFHERAKVPPPPAYRDHRLSNWRIPTAPPRYWHPFARTDTPDA